jgi:hypothetical protein
VEPSAFVGLSRWRSGRAPYLFQAIGEGMDLLKHSRDELDIAEGQRC